MIKGMTGFGRARKVIPPLGKVNLEIRSVNHRYFDAVLHLPDGFMYLERKLKDEISKRIKRGHIVCRLEVNLYQFKKPGLNTRVIKEYHSLLKKVSRQFGLKQDININTLMGLPGIWNMESQSSLSVGWPKIKPLLNEALDKLIQRRRQEGKALYQDMRARAKGINAMLKAVNTRFNKVTKQRLKKYDSDIEKNSFLKSADINEEIVRLNFHLKSFLERLNDKKAVGKELDFMLQEMQRETNTIGAKSIDSFISGRIVSMKSEIERMREQVQNVE
ncbi:MAG: YicC/YloC family endoribonuclease [Candidatus Omnitrophota bacterium]